MRTQNEIGPYVNDYKGNPVLNIPMDRTVFSFGLAKARAILVNIKDIQEFVDTYSTDTF